MGNCVTVEEIPLSPTSGSGRKLSNGSGDVARRSGSGIAAPPEPSKQDSGCFPGGSRFSRLRSPKKGSASFSSPAAVRQRSEGGGDSQAAAADGQGAAAGDAANRVTSARAHSSPAATRVESDPSHATSATRRERDRGGEPPKIPMHPLALPPNEPSPQPALPAAAAPGEGGVGGGAAAGVGRGASAEGAAAALAGAEPGAGAEAGASAAALAGVGHDTSLTVFSYDELRAATGKFRPDARLGEGGFGAVYRGRLRPSPGSEAVDVAVKTLNQEGLQGHQEWLAEVRFLGELHHPHLVRLIGFCAEKEQRLLVYEFMCRGSLDAYLFRRKIQPMPWAVRMRIALDAARGLAYLHEEAEWQVIYRDFKTSNILLDQDFNAKLSDFGLAKDGPEGDKSHVSTRVMGTYGYAAPEYVMTGHLTVKSDVYSFGVVLLEMITGRRSMNKALPPEEQSLVDWAKQFYTDRRKLFKLVDPRLEGNYSIRGAQKAAILAQNCLHRDPKARPLMSDVVKTLVVLQKYDDVAAAGGSGAAGAAAAAAAATAGVSLAGSVAAAISSANNGV
ncbi:hypothetical protein CLOM_g15046 [Closterium sp. NIES-68]|nr:hypothetical protein CLOM_g15046 [Closterium sp. NIES-68]GJP76231.1 hypothetical protein CLOP_g6603 [Closterium sp. NIES-67]